MHAHLVAFAVVEDDNLRRRYFRAGRDQAEPSHAGLEALGAILDADGGGPCVLTPPNGNCEAWRRAMVDHLRANRDAAVRSLTPGCPWRPGCYCPPPAQGSASS